MQHTGHLGQICAGFPPLAVESAPAAGDALQGVSGPLLDN